ncbi:MAG: TVP38/TMEM64 family protein [Christensenellales bacterium]
MKLLEKIKKIKGVRLTKKQFIWLFVFILIIAAIVAFFCIGKSAGWFSIFESKEHLKQYVSSFGVLAPLAFFLLQFFQVVFAPIPGGVTTAVGGMLFGFVYGFIISIVSVILGSICAFYLGRWFGRPLVERIAGKQAVEKYLLTVSSRQRVMLFLMFLLPFFPDDLLCMVAGLSAMRIKTFFIIILFSRPWGFAIFAFLGSNALSLPFWVWIAIAVLAVIAVYIAIKYASQIEERARKSLEKLLKRS